MSVALSKLFCPYLVIPLKIRCRLAFELSASSQKLLAALYHLEFCGGDASIMPVRFIVRQATFPHALIRSAVDMTPPDFMPGLRGAAPQATPGASRRPFQADAGARESPTIGSASLGESCRIPRQNRSKPRISMSTKRVAAVRAACNFGPIRGSMPATVQTSLIHSRVRSISRAIGTSRRRDAGRSSCMITLPPGRRRRSMLRKSPSGSPRYISTRRPTIASNCSEKETFSKVASMNSTFAKPRYAALSLA